MSDDGELCLPIPKQESTTEGTLKAMKVILDNLPDEPISKDATLRDLAEWIKRHLGTLHARSNRAGYLGDIKTNGFSVVEIPDWEMRQKLSNIEEALKG